MWQEVCLFSTASTPVPRSTLGPVQRAPTLISLALNGSRCEPEHSGAHIRHTWSHTSSPPYTLVLWCLIKGSSNLTFDLNSSFPVALRPNGSYGLLIHAVSRSCTTTHHSRQDSSGRVVSLSHRPLPDNTQHSQRTDIHAPGGIRTHDHRRLAAVDLRLPLKSVNINSLLHSVSIYRHPLYSATNCG